MRQSQVRDHRGYLGLDDGRVLALEVVNGRILTRIGIMKHFFGDIMIEIKSETKLIYYKIELWRDKVALKYPGNLRSDLVTFGRPGHICFPA